MIEENRGILIKRLGEMNNFCGDAIRALTQLDSLKDYENVPRELKQEIMGKVSMTKFNGIVQRVKDVVNAETEIVEDPVDPTP